MRAELKVFLGISLITGAVSAGAVWFNIVKAAPRNYAIAIPDMDKTGTALVEEFSKAFDDSRKAYYEKIVMVSGKVLKVEDLDTIVNIYLAGSETYDIKMELLPASFESGKQLNEGDQTQIKGAFAGADEAGDTSDPVAVMLGEFKGVIKFNNSTIIEPK